MAEEKGKLDIEDIKDPEDLDIDKAVSEEEPEKPMAEEAEKEEKEDEVKNDGSEPEDDKDVLEKAVEEESVSPKKDLGKIKPKNFKSKKPWLKYLIIGLVVALFAAAAVWGVMYYLGQKDSGVDTTDTPTEEATKTTDTATDAPTETKYLYINSEVGLNMRQTPDAKAKVLAIIPFGYKITVLEEQSGWVKTNYENKDGWVSVDYTQETDPLVYENTTYGFGFTFKSDWAGYKFIEANNPGSTTVKTYYVALPTTDKKWSEPGLPAGYASMFVMGVYTQTEWAKMSGDEMKPAKLGESAKYVYTYLPAQAYATDLKLQYNEIKDIIETFEVLK